MIENLYGVTDLLVTCLLIAIYDNKESRLAPHLSLIQDKVIPSFFAWL